MKKMYIVLIFLFGCSSSSQWVKMDGSSYESNQLSLAKAQCDYKLSMKRSNVLMMKLNPPPPARVFSNEKDEDIEKQERISANDQQLLEANRKSKEKSFAIAKKAHQCMQSKGFVRM